MIRCYECPRCKDQPGKTDYNGNHFAICGMSGNMVYLKPRRERRYNGKGWISFSASSCGIYRTFDDAFNAMTKNEQKRWRENRQITLEELLKEERI
jgi:hypothetical protein